VDFEIVETGPSDFPAVIWPDLNGFGMVGLDDEKLVEYRTNFADARILGARADGEWVGTIGEYPFELTLPGGAMVPAAGVTWAAVLPTHRRRGVLSALMGRLLDDVAERGWPVATLLASEAGIYPRYGFGVATQYASFRCDPRHAQLRGDSATASSPVATAADPPPVRLVADAAQATALAAEVWERYRTTRPGLTTRRPWTWDHLARDPSSERDGFSGWVWAFHRDATGATDGYARYRMKEQERDGLPAGVLRVGELVGLTPAVEADLFTFLCGVDLIRTVELPYRPVDDPLPWRLLDRRQLVVTEMGDFGWLRVLDVAATLATRRYGAVDELVLEVHDGFRPEGSGRYLLRTGPREPEVERLAGSSPAPGGYQSLTETTVDLSLDVADLASLVLGTVAPSVLAAAGRLHARDPEVLARADACFRTGLAPFTNTEY
jgi:predicted acetyltransferase